MHVCGADAGGLWICDIRPTHEAFESFFTGSDFLNLPKACVLPAPRVTPVGEVHAALAIGNHAV
jgi:hypothetical protein